MSNIEWDAPIEAYHEDGTVLPAKFLKRGLGYVDVQFGDRTWTGLEQGYIEAGWRVRNVKPQPIDWSAPIEAVHEDGRVVPAEAGTTMGVARADYRIALVDGLLRYFDRTTGAGRYSDNPWRIRNVATKPVRTAAEMLDRLEALARRMAEDHKPGVHYVTQMEPLRDEARAIVAEMTPPVDPDLIEARKIMRGQLMMTNGSRFDNMRQEDLETLAVNALKRGRELERGA